MAWIIFTILATALCCGLFLMRRKRKVSAFGIETFDGSENLTFSTENRLFRYIGYRDLPLGKFTISSNAQGQVFFIPILLTSNDQGISNQAARNMDIPYISGSINGNTFSGEVKSPVDFWYKGSMRNKPLIRIYYGVY